MMHLICDWAGFYCFWGLRVFRLCLRPVEKNRNKSRSLRPKLVTHTHRTFLWTILKRKMKNSTWRICLNTCTPFLSPSFSFFFFCSGCTIARWRGEWLPVRPPRASIDLHRVQKLNNSTHAHMACRQSLWRRVQDIHFKAWMQVNTAFTCSDC